MSDLTFGTLGVPAPLCALLAERGITRPTPIQSATLPDSLAGKDVLGRGRTGSGKTYAFLLPLVARLSASTAPRKPGRPRALVLAPTRELVTQIEEALAPLAATAGLTTRTIFGGVGQNPQVAALRRGVDVILACPGRLEDLIKQGHASLEGIEITVLDEADHMADLGFLPVVKRLLDRTPARGQRMLFSATLDDAVHGLVGRYLHAPVVHEADSLEAPVGTMTHHVLHVDADARLDVLLDLTAAPGRTMVFTRTKHGAKKLAKQLNAAGVPAVELHGNLSQNARVRTMEAFHCGAAATLVATDIAARGIHVDDVALVVHADPPAEHKAYLHRSGRTARAGAAGTVVTLMLDTQRADVRDLTRKAGIRPTITRVRPGDGLLREIAPGERAYPGPYAQPVGEDASRASDGRPAAGRRTRTAPRSAAATAPRRTGAGRGTAPAAAPAASGAPAQPNRTGASPARGTSVVGGVAAFSRQGNRGRRR